MKLTKQDEETRSQTVDDLRTKWIALEAAIAGYNQLAEEIRAPLVEALEAYNEALSHARNFCQAVQGSAQGDFDGKSERWQEGKQGQAAQEWIDEWENVALDDLEIYFPSDLEIDIPLHADDIENLPTSSESE